jgi:arylsulfatase A-like enzyme
MKKYGRTAFSTVALGTSALFAAEVSAKPNVLVIYLDDMGWGQPSCYGGKLAATPNIDALASRGIRFTSAYVSAPVCGPSRVGLMTGRYQQHTGHDANVTPKQIGNGMDLKEVTFAQRMKAAGYTTGIVGKWHLGAGPEFLPVSRGFDDSYGTVGNPDDYADGTRFYRGAELVKDPPDFPVTAPVYRDEAIRFIEANQKNPWFLYLALNSVHGPVVASEDMLKRFAQLPKNEQAYAAMITEADEVIGDVLAEITKLNLDESTLIFLLSDNGGASPLAEMGGLSGKKWLVWEGGIRVSWITAWKGHIPAGRVSDEPIIQLDILPTALTAAGENVLPEWGLDGVNILPLLEGRVEKLEPRTLYWRFGVQYALRQGNWKLVKAGINLPPMLINLANDPGEQTDLTAQYPEKKSELQNQWEQWNSTMKPPRWNDYRWNNKDSAK